MDGETNHDTTNSNNENEEVLLDMIPDSKDDSTLSLLPREDAKDHKESYEDTTLYCKKILSAVFYGLASFLITVVNKTTLTTYKFPSFLFVSLGQITASILVLTIAKKLKYVSYANLGRNTFKKIFPLPLIYLGNMMFGLGGTQALSLPMFAALRRFCILMTMALEFYILNVRPTFAVQLSVYAMVAGALIAASDDLSFNMKGYTYAMITNALTASNGVFVKKKLDSVDIGKYGLMFYNSLFMFVPTLLLTYVSGDIDVVLSYEHWHSFWFLINFFSSCFMGFILSYSTILCTQYNSALTTTIVGCLKNVCVTYLGMFIGNDYVFSLLNFIGINISIFASLLYTYVTFKRKKVPADRNVPIPNAHKGETV